MKNKLLIIYLVISWSCFFSCRKGSNKSYYDVVEVSVQDSLIHPIDVHIDLANNCLPFDSLVTKASYVKLETTRDNLIGRISQLLFVADKIIVVDARRSKTITVYDEKGHYLNRIGSLGQGPHEYGSLDDVMLTPDKKMLAITDLGHDCIKYYDFNGDYIKSVKIPYWFCNCEFLTDNILAGYYLSGIVLPGGNPEYKPLLAVTDLSKNILYTAFKCYYSKYFTSSILKPLRKFDDHVFFNNPNTDSIFVLTKSGPRLRYHLNIEGANKIKIYDGITDKLLDKQHQHNPFFNGDFIELKDGAIFHVFELGSSWYRFGIYSNVKQQTLSCNGLLKNPFFYFFTQAPQARYKDNTVVVDVRPDIILSYKSELYRLGKKEEIDELYQDLTEDSNPVLFFYELKF